MQVFETIAEWSLGLGALLMATVFSPSAIPNKDVGDAFSSAEFNELITSVQLFYRDDNGTTSDITDDKVGVGNPTPAHALDVIGTVNATGDLRADGNLYVNTIYGDGSGLTNVTSGGTWILTGDDINYPDGKVGVGAGVPNYQFDIKKTGMDVFHIGSDAGSDLSIDVGGSEGLVNLVAGAEFDTSEYTYTGSRGASRLKLHDGAVMLTTGDTNAGSAGNGVAWNTGIHIDNEGEVGIGVATPEYRLDVAGQLRVSVPNDSFMSGLFTSADDENYIQLQSTNVAPTASGVRVLSGSSVVAVQNYDMVNNRWDFYAGSDLSANRVMSIKSNGRVGIGVSNPDEVLHVNGNIKWGSGMLKADQGGSLELGDASSNPYIDFKNDPTSDYDVRLSLTGNDTLEIAGGTLVAPEPTTATEVANKKYVDDRTAFAEVTNTVVADANNSSGEVITFNTTALHNSNSGIFNPLATGVQLLEAGTYEVQTNLYLTSTVQRANVAVEFTINGTEQAVRGASAYMRSLNGHNESSAHLSQILTVGANDIIGVTTTRLAASGTVAVPVGKSNLIIKKLQ